MSDSKVALLVGGAGFVGSFVAKELISRGVKPIIFDSFFQYTPNIISDTARESALRKRFEGIQDKIEVVRGNAVFYSEISAAVNRFNPDVVIQLAGLPLANLSNGHVEESMVALGSVGTIIDVLKKSGRYPRFVYVSSSTVYGDFKYDPVDETHPTTPKGVYAGVKLASEILVRSLCAHFKLPYVIVRPQAVYGPTDVNKRVLQCFIENAIAGYKIEVRDPETRVDFTYVKDAARGLVLAAVTPDVEGHTFNISYGEGRSLQDAVDILRNYFPSLECKYTEADTALPRRGGLDISKAKKLLGYQPSYNLETGIAEYLESMNDFRVGR